MRVTRGVRFTLVFGVIGLALVMFASRSRAGEQGAPDANISLPSSIQGLDAGAVSVPRASATGSAPHGQPGTQEASSSDSLGSRYQIPISAHEPPEDHPAAALNPTSTNPAVFAASDDALIAKAKYDVFSYHHAEKVFTQQRTMTWVIFIVVLVLVAVGLVFSWYQFKLGIEQTRAREARVNQRERERVADALKGGKHKPIPASDGAVEEASPPAPVTEFSAGPDGFKISSPVIGLVILGMSLGFFYLYLKYVYPIVNIDRP